jgi:hypothetical protein
LVLNDAIAPSAFEQWSCQPERGISRQQTVFIGGYAELLRRIPQGHRTTTCELNEFRFRLSAACGLLISGQMKLKMNFNFAKKEEKRKN